MSRPPARWIALALSTIVAGVAFALFMRWRAQSAENPDLKIVAGDAEGAREAFENAPPVEPNQPWSDYPYHLPEEAARKLYPELASTRTRYDPFTGYTSLANSHERRDWPEHPNGFYERQTNSLGLIRTTEIASERPDIRVLVTGDSHVDGVCNADETFPAQLEHLLTKRFPNESVEVLNGGASGYAFYEYRGALERYYALGVHPDLFVVTVFGGNDFTGLFHLWRFFVQGRDAQDRRGAQRAEQQRLQRSAPREFVPVYGQGLSSVSYFHNFPDDAPIALKAACDLTQEIQQRCQELGTQLLVLFLPAPSELPDQCERERISAAAEYAQLSAADLGRLTTLRIDYLRRIEELGIAILDLHPLFAQHEGELFWRRDLHLNIEGHAAAAAALEPHVLELLGR